MNGSCWQWAFVQLSFKPHFLFEVWLAEANVSAYISLPDLLLEIFACFQLSFAKLHMMGMLNEDSSKQTCFWLAL